MEKLHKYCLSVLLVIICSNISAQATNGSFENNDDCQQLYRLCSQILNQNREVSGSFCVNRRSIRNFAIGYKEKAVDLIGRGLPDQNQNSFFKSTFGTDFGNSQKHQLFLYNYEKSSKDNLFAGILYFKTKVSKVRNKDYLDII
ncbi:hypothetical protein [Flavobacterium sp. B17]|uniref:hypothetical protein n=1 Tax=Flavobacterium sp. B17 TaxID=95618 RepID=UPI0005B267BE|nr:hypothetical protein [Flavobacterium sp. B17]